MTHIEIRGMSFFHGDDGRNPYRTLAIAEIYMPELTLTIREIRLTWSSSRGYVALAPATHKAPLPQTVVWLHRSAFGKELAAKLVDMFERMGGSLPGPKPVMRLDHVTGKPIGRDVFDGAIEESWADAHARADAVCEQAVANSHRKASARADAIAAAKSGEMERRVFPATWSAVEDDKAGLHRVLGVDAVAETLERAGL
jgi:hypothetical protein